MSASPASANLVARAAVHAALGEPARLAIADELVLSDRSPKELGDRLGLPSNLLAHHLEVLEDAGLITRFVSAGDGRRKYVRLLPDKMPGTAALRTPAKVLFLCSHNSARSQLAAAIWRARTGRSATSAGTHPAAAVHRDAVAAARRSGLDLAGATPRLVGSIPRTAQVITVCDRVHEELEPGDDWWHWSIPDPVDEGPAAFDRVIKTLDRRISCFVNPASPRRSA